jgi:diacylglycerol O-acyltransferase
MEQLSGIDAGFLYMETPTLHMHTLKVAIISPTDAPGDYSFTRFRDVLERNLHLLPSFRRRLVHAPLGIGYPFWIEDPDFDLDRHIHCCELASPGGLRELSEIVSQVASTSLDRSRPLWEITMVTGLEGGRLGYVAKLHHSIADGIASLSMLLNLMRDAPKGVLAMPAAPTTPAAWKPERVPDSKLLFAAALVHGLRDMIGLPRLIARTLRGLMALRRHIREHTVDTPTPFQLPTTSFNTALTPNRVFATSPLDLGRILAVRKAAGATVNDVVMAICAGAIEDYLASRGEPIHRALIVSVPVGTDPGDQGRLTGNHVSNLTGSLCNDIADPVARLAAIHEIMADAKQRQDAMGLDLLERWVELGFGGAYSRAMYLFSKSHLARYVKPPVNLIISNVPGPRNRLRMEGGELDAILSVGPILEGIGLNITAWSYDGQMHFSLISCPEFMPDPWDLLARFSHALAELETGLGLSVSAPAKTSSSSSYRSS